MTSCDLLGFSPSCCLLLFGYSAVPLGWVCCLPAQTLISSPEPSVADEEAEMQQQMCRPSFHLLSDAPHKFDANVQIATTVNVFEI